MPVRLSLENLDALPEGVARPSYARDELTPGILHIGVGNFHRAHQQVYLDRLFAKGRSLEFGILGASIMPSDAEMLTTLASQDYLTTVVTQSAEASEARVTGPMVGHLPAGDMAAIFESLCSPIIRIASLTVTEGGYYVDADTGAFDAEHPDIAAEGRADTPRTVFGLLARALAVRRDDGLPPFTVMSCDNLPHNGHVARDAVVGTADHIDPTLADWIGREVAFPNGMVDRITPATGDRERRIVRDEFGIDDQAPVFCEDFIQWVLEDAFPQGRPALDAAGVQFVSDVTPFETMKLRILNGGHAIIGYPAGLLGIEFVHEAMADEQIAAFLRRVEETEILPVVPAVPDTDIAAYLARIEERFANPKIGDQVRRLCLDGSNRQPKFIVPTIADRLEDDRPVRGLALESALWCRYCEGTTEGGAEIAPNDPNWDRLTETARKARSDPDAWLGMRDIYGASGGDDRFRRAFADALAGIREKGVRGALADYLAG